MLDLPLLFTKWINYVEPIKYQAFIVPGGWVAHGGGGVWVVYGGSWWVGVVLSQDGVAISMLGWCSGR